MNIIKKFFSFIKNIFVKQDDIKQLQEPKIVNEQNQKETFIESLKVTPLEKIKKGKVSTLVCEGDGLRNTKKDIFIIKEAYIFY